MSNPESSWKAFLCLESPLERIWTKGRQAIYIYLAPPLPVKDAMWYLKQCACAPLSLGSTQLVRNCATNCRAISTRRHRDVNDYFNIQQKKIQHVRAISTRRHRELYNYFNIQQKRFNTSISFCDALYITGNFLARPTRSHKFIFSWRCSQRRISQTFELEKKWKCEFLF